MKRRQLHFASIPDLLAELERVEAADKEGTLATTGNWSPGQILAHLAAWIDYGWDGFPVKPPPFFIKWILVWMGRRILRRGMSPGTRIPGVKAGTYGQDDVSVSEGLKRLRRSLSRLQAGEQAKFDSPAFGPLSHQDRILLNLRHAELHLSYLSY